MQIKVIKGAMVLALTTLGLTACVTNSPLDQWLDSINLRMFTKDPPDAEESIKNPSESKQLETTHWVKTTVAQQASWAYPLMEQYLPPNTSLWKNYELRSKGSLFEPDYLHRTILINIADDTFKHRNKTAFLTIRRFLYRQALIELGVCPINLQSSSTHQSIADLPNQVQLLQLLQCEGMVSYVTAQGTAVNQAQGAAQESQILQYVPEDTYIQAFTRVNRLQYSSHDPQKQRLIQDLATAGFAMASQIEMTLGRRHLVDTLSAGKQYSQDTRGVRYYETYLSTRPGALLMLDLPSGTKSQRIKKHLRRRPIDNDEPATPKMPQKPVISH